MNGKQRSTDRKQTIEKSNVDIIKGKTLDSWVKSLAEKSMTASFNPSLIEMLLHTIYSSL